jgi:hypothetical protein
MADQLQAFMEQNKGLLSFEPTEDDRKKALTYGLIGAGLGILSANAQNPRGAGFAGAVGGAAPGLQMYQQTLQNAPKERMQNLAGMMQLRSLQSGLKRDEAVSNMRFTNPAAQQLAAAGLFKEAIQRENPEQKFMGVGDNLVDVTPGRTPSSVFTAPPKPQLLELGVHGQPGVKQKAWGTPGQTDFTPIGGQILPEILNPDVQKARADVARAGRAQVNTNILPPQKSFEYEDKLRADFTADPTVKASSEMDSAFRLIESAYQRPSAANDLAMATKYMKILDPSSVVRESEFALAVNATGLLDKVQNYAASIIEGKKLNPTQRKDFYESAKAINDAFQGKRREVEGQYSEMATGYGLNPKNVIPSLRRRSTDRNDAPPAPDANVMRFDSSGRLIK